MTQALQSSEHTWRFDLENGGAYCSWCKQIKGEEEAKCHAERKPCGEMRRDYKKTWEVSKYSAPCPKCGGKPLIDPDPSYYEEKRECSDCDYHAYIDEWPWLEEQTTKGS